MGECLSPCLESRLHERDFGVEREESSLPNKNRSDLGRVQNRGQRPTFCTSKLAYCQQESFLSRSPHKVTGFLYHSPFSSIHLLTDCANISLLTYIYQAL